ncbi:hypothetical protein, partial [Streptomyces somaliensis]
FPQEAVFRAAHADGVPADGSAPTTRTNGTYTPRSGTADPARSGVRAAVGEDVPADPPAPEASRTGSAPTGADFDPADALRAGTVPDDDPLCDPSGAPGPSGPGTAADAALADAALAETSGTVAGDEDGTGDEDGDERIRTLIWTAATYRPLEEVAALVTQLKHTGAVDSPADEALRAAAVARPLEEVRRLVAMLNEAGHTLDETDTTLRAAAVGRPVEDVVQLVSILGADDGPEQPRPTAAPAGPPDAGTEGGGLQPVPEDPRVRPPRSVAAATAAAAGKSPVRVLTPEPVGGGTVPASRSALRWPAAAALFVCGVLHLPADFAAMWSGGYAHAVALVIAVLCLVLGEWLVVRDTVRVWGSAAVLSIGVVALHGMAGSSGVGLLQSSLGRSWTWSGAAAVTCAMLTALLAGSALLRRQREADAADGA